MLKNPRQERVLIGIGQQVLKRMARHQHTAKPLGKVEISAVCFDPGDGKLVGVGSRPLQHDRHDIHAGRL
jgi:hypothetical protein